MLGECHIFSGVSSTGEHFSLRFDSYKQGAVRLFEARGSNNQFISQEIVVNILCRKLSAGEIKVNHKTDSIKKDFMINDVLLALMLLKKVILMEFLWLIVKSMFFREKDL